MIPSLVPKPTQLKDSHLTQGSIKRLHTILEHGGKNLLLAGPPGSGKSLILSLIPKKFRNTLCFYHDPWELPSNSSDHLEYFCQQTKNPEQIKFVIVDDIDELSDSCQMKLSQCSDTYGLRMKIIATTCYHQNLIPELQKRFQLVKIRYPSKVYMRRMIRRCWCITPALSNEFIDRELLNSRKSLHAIFAMLDKSYLLNEIIHSEKEGSILSNSEDGIIRDVLQYAEHGPCIQALKTAHILLNNGVCPQDILESIGNCIEKSNRIHSSLTFSKAVLFSEQAKSARGGIYMFILLSLLNNNTNKKLIYM